MTLEQLTAQLEAATGDAPLLFRMALDLAHMEGWITDLQWSTANLQIIHGAYIDAALTLVPEDVDWLVRTGIRRNFRDGAYAHIMRGEVNAQGQSIGEGWHPTPAIALCIAALKAREDLP